MSFIKTVIKIACLGSLIIILLNLFGITENKFLLIIAYAIIGISSIYIGISSIISKRKLSKSKN